jgi:DNA polymerase-4
MEKRHFHPIETHRFRYHLKNRVPIQTRTVGQTFGGDHCNGHWTSPGRFQQNSNNEIEGSSDFQAGPGQAGMQRKIIHLDLDAFYASVEQRDFPELRGLPVIVGGGLERGVVCACSYEARRFGVHSAMAMARALRLCPEAKLRPVRMERYRCVSRQVFEVFDRFTDLIEPLSVDEAFLDVTGSERLFGQATEIAAAIRKAVRDETGLAISAGVASNKFLAKLGSEQAKPDGLFEVPQPPDAFLRPLPLGRLWGVGPVTRKQLECLGLKTVGDLLRFSRDRLARLFGKAGSQLYDLARGIDPRPVEPPEEPKSIGHEDTYVQDLLIQQERQRALLDLAERVGARLRRHRLAGQTVTLKVRFTDFTTVTRSRTLNIAVDHAMDIYPVALELLERTEARFRPVRLLGISLGRLQAPGGDQGELFGGTDRQRQAALDQAVDRLRGRYGFSGVCRGTLLERSSGTETGNKGGK